MTVLYDVGLSVLSGLVASAVFLGVLLSFRPKIAISDLIARQEDNSGKFFSFKLINRSRRACQNVRVEATLAQPSNVEGGHVFWTTHIPIKKSEVFEIPGYKKSDHNADFAWRFVTDWDLDELWSSDEGILRFRVLATDSVTSFSRAFKKEFRLPRNSIKSGTHKFGSELDVS